MSVTCESCGRQYAYTMTRSVEYGPRQIWRTEADATMALDNLLKKGCDIVPCPDCGALTQAMKAEKQSNRGCGLTAILLGFLICVAVYLIMNSSGDLYYGIGLVGVALIAIGLKVLLSGKFE